MKDVVICDKPRVAENSVNPWISEWGNPAGVMSSHPDLIGKLTRGTETSKYPEEEKTIVIP